jgi:hypothetical protein
MEGDTFECRKFLLSRFSNYHSLRQILRQSESLHQHMCVVDVHVSLYCDHFNIVIIHSPLKLPSNFQMPLIWVYMYH